MDTVIIVIYRKQLRHKLLCYDIHYTYLDLLAAQLRERVSIIKEMYQFLNMGFDQSIHMKHMKLDAVL